MNGRDIRVRRQVKLPNRDFLGMGDRPIGSNRIERRLDVVFLPLQHLPDVENNVSKGLSGTPKVRDTNVVTKVGMENLLVGHGMGLFLRIAHGKGQYNEGLLRHRGPILVVEPQRRDIKHQVILLGRERTYGLHGHVGVPIKTQAQLCIVIGETRYSRACHMLGLVPDGRPHIG